MARISTYPVIFCAALTVVAPLAGVAASSESFKVDTDDRLAPGETVADRGHPDYTPRGIRVGTFLLHPDIHLDTRSDDNIYYTATGQVSDWVTSVTPSLSIASDWTRHAISVDVGGTAERYASNTSEDSDAYWLTLKGRVDFLAQSFITLEAGTEKNVESRGSPDNTLGLTPTKVLTNHAKAALEYRPSRMFVKSDLEVTELNYDDVLTSTGATINNDDRDRTQLQGSVTLGYEVTPQYDAFVRFAYDNRDYKSSVDDLGVNRDSTGYTLLLGTDLDLGGVLAGEVALGAMHYEHYDPSFRDVDGMTGKALLYWYVTPLTTLTFQLQRDVEETTAAGASSYVTDTLAVNAYHELLRNLVLQATLAGSHDVYKSNGREDDTSYVQLFADYKLNRTLYFGAKYEYGSRDSNAAGNDYDRSAVSLTVGAHF